MPSGSPLLDPTRARDIEAVAQVLAAELLEEGHIGKHLLLEPLPPGLAAGAHSLGTVVYAEGEARSRRTSIPCRAEKSSPRHSER